MPFVQKLKKSLKKNKAVRNLHHQIQAKLPPQPHTVVFVAFHGRGYMDSPKAIFEQMRSMPEFSDWKFVWAIRKGSRKGLNIPGATIVNYGSEDYYSWMERAGWWVTNCLMETKKLKKRKGQTYLQTWHGTPLKRLGADIPRREGQTFNKNKFSHEEMVENYRSDSSRMDWFVSPSPFTDKVFPSAFLMPEDRLLKCGYPRNDQIIQADSTACQEARKNFDIPEGKKVLLYAPTFRDSAFDEKDYLFTLEIDFDQWQETLGEDWLILFKPHYLLNTSRIDLERVRVLPEGTDANQLLLAADALVTDYSSIMFDYALLKRPLYLYMPDVATYAGKTRGFYFDIQEDMKPSIYESQKAMVEDIRNGVWSRETVDKINRQYNARESGQSAKSVVRTVFLQEN